MCRKFNSKCARGAGASLGGVSRRKSPNGTAGSALGDAGHCGTCVELGSRRGKGKGEGAAGHCTTRRQNLDLSEHLQLGQTLQGVSSTLNITEQGPQCLSSQLLMWKSFFLVRNLPGLFYLCTTVHRFSVSHRGMDKESNCRGFKSRRESSPAEEKGRKIKMKLKKK